MDRTDFRIRFWVVIITQSLTAIALAYEMQRLAPGDSNLLFAIAGVAFTYLFRIFTFKKITHYKEDNDSLFAGVMINSTVMLIALLWLLANIGTNPLNLIYVVFYILFFMISFIQNTSILNKTKDVG